MKTAKMGISPDECPVTIDHVQIYWQVDHQIYSGVVGPFSMRGSRSVKYVNDDMEVDKVVAFDDEQ